MAASGKKYLTVPAIIALGGLCAGFAAWAQYSRPAAAVRNAATPASA